MRVGLIGAGRMGGNYLKALGADVSFDILDPPRGLRPEAPEAWDAAVIAAPTRLHAAIALPLLQRGLPVLVEKPVAATLDEAEALAGYATCFVGHIERFNPTLVGMLPGPRFVQAERLAPWVDRGIDVDVVLDLMIHDLDLFLWQVGADPVVDVRANGVSVATDQTDLAHARVETARGVVGTFTASRVSRKRARTWRVFAAGREYASLDLDGRVAVRARWEGGPVEAQVEVPEQNALVEQVRAFLKVVGGGERDPRLASAREGAQALTLAMQVRAALG